MVLPEFMAPGAPEEHQVGGRKHPPLHAVGPLSRRSVLAVLTGSAVMAGLALKPGVAFASPPRASAPVGYRDPINIGDFGAVGDGKKDDTEAIQRALNSAAKDKIPLVIVPPGTYLITKPLVATAPLRVAGFGEAVSVLSFSTDAFANSTSNGLTIIQTDPNAYPGAMMQVVDLDITWPGSGAAVYFNQEEASSTVEAFQDTQVVGCRFYLSGSGGSAVYIVNQRDSLVTNCQFLGSGTGVGSGVLLDDSDNSKITDNVFYQLTYGVQGYRGSDRVFDAGTIVMGNTMYGFVDALHFDGWELVQAIGNILDGCSNSGCYLSDCYHSIIADNYLGITGDGPAFLVQTVDPWGTQYLGTITIRGNYVNHYEGSSGEATLLAQGASSELAINQMIIEGNTFYSYPDYGIKLKNVANALISGNVFNRASLESTASIYDETPGQNYIYHNLIDEPIKASGDDVFQNFVSSPFGTLSTPPSSSGQIPQSPTPPAVIPELNFVNALQLQSGQTLAQVFETDTAFSALAAAQPCYGTNGVSGNTLTLREGAGLGGSAVYSYTFTKMDDNYWSVLVLPSPAPAGTYTLVFSDPVGKVGLWSPSATEPDGYEIVNGVPGSGAQNFVLGYWPAES